MSSCVLPYCNPTSYRTSILSSYDLRPTVLQSYVLLYYRPMSCILPYYNPTSYHIAVIRPTIL
jgi:hypothetical protein